MRTAAAIADPVRRQILEVLRERPVPAGEVAELFEISRPAISRHLRVLRECGLVRDDLIGRRRIYSVDPTPLREITDWIASFAPAVRWEQRFDALETEVVRTRRGSAGTRQNPTNIEESA